MEGYDYVDSDDGGPVVDVKRGGNLGITPRSIKMLFEKISMKHDEDEDIKFSVSCSFLQIY